MAAPSHGAVGLITLPGVAVMAFTGPEGGGGCSGGGGGGGTRCPGRRLGSNYAQMCVSESEGHGSFFSFKGVK